MAKIFITGGAGFIGSALAQRLVENNCLVLMDLNFDLNSLGYTGLIGHRNVTCLKGDVMDGALLQPAVQDADIIIHAAAVIGVNRVLARPIDALEVNFVGTSNLLRAIAPGQKIDRFIYFSTSEVFGAYAFRVADDHPTSFGSVNEARWCYSIGKVAGEHLVQGYHRQYGLPTVIIRPFNIFGPGRIGDHVMLRFICQALLNKDLVVLQDGSQIRAWCYIDDFCDAALACLQEPRAIGSTFNLGNPRNTLTIYELAKKVIALLNSRSRIRFQDISYSDIDVRVPNTAGAKEILGFEPKVEIEEGILRTARWYEQRLDDLKKMYDF